MKTESKDRVAVTKAYPGDRWATKVKNMTDEQIAAIYLRLKAQGKIK